MVGVDVSSFVDVSSVVDISSNDGNVDVDDCYVLGLGLSFFLATLSLYSYKWTKSYYFSFFL
jgi:hypothetical protein